ncbi:S1 family peptidase [Tuwongella immobilis]|uniref:Thioredoxin domain-containing protein n=1 Tax=Tuwongella immobilis TaxID=692036 RepID=A0A6C2YPF1_9BACT|nr:serine protease [Tuwongella immobilis]VIP03508.1 Trypsin-like protein serine protease typically periplasmic containing C-terminal PDZ domain OS=Planctomyces limnophilus (strain ATCC 43296 / DSM 3776 / IFAM 1008 / 290) GN=Plim_1010 PE=4 SV=1: Trypsin_2 [Tuwongella immobilis]VTS04384.1 Trypsin-like protein serine protease typically periplasmic containing C-terminal PDZ domain OS=Planctomyces limnophilus (strain ATCC 43296 / DSM 3776 / IFAM 1008 / 290) GN=Plim_1010 PE=4 SV=1: Trypsin_2 [Tuwongell
MPNLGTPIGITVRNPRWLGFGLGTLLLTGLMIRGFAVTASEPEKPPTAAAPMPIVPERGNDSTEWIDDSATIDRFVEQLGKFAEAGTGITGERLEAALEIDRVFPMDAIAPPAESLTPEQIAEKARASTWLIGCVPAKGAEAGFDDGWFATAWTIGSDGILLTNWHVFENAREMIFGVMNAQGEIFPVVDLLACDKLADLAVIRIPKRGLPALPIAQSAPKPGAWVGLLSHPGNELFTFTQGHVTRYVQHFGGLAAFGEQWMGVTTDYAGGSSGGPILDRTGAVVGMACLTSNIDSEEPTARRSRLHRPAIRRRAIQDAPKAGADGPQAAQPSSIQMVVKLAVPLVMIRQIITKNHVPGSNRPIPLATWHAEIRKRAARQIRQLEQAMKLTENARELDSLQVQITEVEQAALQAVIHLARATPNRPESIPLLVECIERGDLELVEQVVGLLGHFHLKSEAVLPALWQLAESGLESEAILDFLQAVLESNPHRSCQAVAALAGGILSRNHLRIAPAEEVESTAQAVAEMLAFAEKSGTNIRPTADDPDAATIARRLQAGLANLRNCEVGGKHPEILGTDLANRPIRVTLLEKPTLLLTWDEAEHATETNLQTIQAIRRRFPAATLQMVGISAITDRTKAQKMVENAKIDWTVLHNDQTAAQPGILDRLNLDSQPMIRLIDATGTVRSVWTTIPPERELQTAIRKIIEERSKQPPK